MKKKVLQITAVAVLTVSELLLGTTTRQPTKTIVPEGYIKLEECIPLEDVACYFIDSYDYPCFELKDVGNQLDNPNNRSYVDIMSTLDNMTEEYKANGIIN